MPEIESKEKEELVTDGLMTVEEAAKFLSVCEGTLYKLMDNGQLAYVRPTPKARRLPRKAVVAYAAARLVPARD